MAKGLGLNPWINTPVSDALFGGKDKDKPAAPVETPLSAALGKATKMAEEISLVNAQETRNRAKSVLNDGLDQGTKLGA